ncbi:glycosyltransferase [Histidinibacterium lentulum]|uniref:Glycosyltransferase n=1 Tax=Histidinibacterium lentulum TaxID=2480588 RepID=A0A3N2R8V9_9RHOB|nr:glycosyltransferase [Histidinibacterium lentulum]
MLVAAPPFAGHLDRLVPLIRAAQDAGHGVRVLTGHARLSLLQARGIEAVAPPSLPDGALEQIAEGFGRISGRPGAALAQLRANFDLLPALTADLCAELEVWRADVLVADSVALMAGPAAARTGVPWITTVASPLSLHTSGGTPAFMGGWNPPRGWPGRVRDGLGRMAQDAAREAVFALMRARLPPELARPFRPDGSETIYSPQAILGFGMTELEFPRDWPAAFEMIGPLASAPSFDPPPDLPDARRAVFATLGTHLHWARAAWRGGLERLARDRPRWLIVASEGRMAGGAEARTGPPNLITVPRLCYRRDLPRFDAVIHHGGSGIALSAIAAGLPSLVVPHDFDQADMAARIAWHGLGLRARSLAGAARSLDRLMGEEWPALPRFAEAAARYRPEERFLAALARVTGSA